MQVDEVNVLWVFFSLLHGSLLCVTSAGAPSVLFSDGGVGTYCSSGKVRQSIRKKIALEVSPKIKMGLSHDPLIKESVSIPQANIYPCLLLYCL